MSFDLDDEKRIAFARVNWAADRYGDGPEYRRAWAEFAALVELGQTTK